MFRTNWLGLEEWNNLGLKISSTTSNEAVKLYDAALTQFACLYDDSTLGGLPKTLAKLNDADPNFILGHSLQLALGLSSTETYFHNGVVKKMVDDLEKMIEQRKSEITDREYKHALASCHMARMNEKRAIEIYEDILEQYPNDLQALKLCFYGYLFLGQKEQNYNLIAKAHPHFVMESHPFHKYIDGMLGFVLEETAKYKEGEKYAKLGLEKNPYDAWATHSLAHVYEMIGKFQEGTNFMNKTVDFWSKSNHIAGHNFWHLSLFNVSLDQFDEALNLFDKEIYPRLHASRRMLPLCDASSLLYRLSLLNVDEKGKYSLRSKYDDIYNIAKPYYNLHISPFTDVHYMMSCLGTGHLDEAKQILETLESSDLKRVSPEQASVTKQLLEAMINYENQNYSVATEQLVAVKDSVLLIGGSDAQRDVFNQLLIVCAMKSTKPEHKRLMEQLAKERNTFKKDDRFIQQLQSSKA